MLPFDYLLELSVPLLYPAYKLYLEIHFNVVQQIAQEIPIASRSEWLVVLYTQEIIITKVFKTFLNSQTADLCDNSLIKSRKPAISRTTRPWSTDQRKSEYLNSIILEKQCTNWIQLNNINREFIHVTVVTPHSDFFTELTLSLISDKMKCDKWNWNSQMLCLEKIIDSTLHCKYSKDIKRCQIS